MIPTDVGLNGIRDGVLIRNGNKGGLAPSETFALGLMFHAIVPRTANHDSCTFAEVGSFKVIGLASMRVTA